MITNKYKLLEKINEGSFGVLVKGKNIRTDEFVAIKVEPRVDNIKTVKMEAKIYQYLGNQVGFPQLKWFYTDEKYNYLVIDLLGTSLRKMVEHKLQIDCNSIINIAIQIFTRIKFIHDKHLLHRDIKPDNFLFGIDSKKDILYLIDFGLCKRYFNNGHIKMNKLTKVIGSYNYISLNIHNLIEPSRRDDLESAIYILIFLHFGKLGWENKSSSEIYKEKENIMKLQLIPNYIKLLLTYVRTLEFETEPNYDYIFDILKCEKEKINKFTVKIG